MSERSQACQDALAAIEQDPLELPPAVMAHVARCPACAEARVQWLAMEEAPQALAPAGYFDQLPGRILGKLPARPVRTGQHRWLWAMAASLMVAVGLGGFLLGRANREPMVEATLAPATQDQALPQVLPETPFHIDDDDLSQVRQLSPEAARALIQRMDAKDAKR